MKYLAPKLWRKGGHLVPTTPSIAVGVTFLLPLPVIERDFPNAQTQVGSTLLVWTLDCVVETAEQKETF